MKSNFSNIQKLLSHKSLVLCFLAIIILINASIVFSEDLNFNNTETKVKINSPVTSFNLFTGCNSALNILGGTPYYDNDCKTDISIWRPGTMGQFWIWNSSQNNSIVHGFGTTGDIPLGGDYDGDGITDLAVYHKLGQQEWWRIFNSANSSISETHFGTFPYDYPTPADFDGDGKTDIAIFRKEGTVPTITPKFYFINSNGVINPDGLSFSNEPDINVIPVVNDYNGDGKADFAIWRKSNYSSTGIGAGNWKIKESGTTADRLEQWGSLGDIPVPGKYAINGLSDNKVDLAIFRPSTRDWWIKNSNGGGTYVVHFGSSGDEPVPGDYDGDGIWDIAVRRESNGTFHILGSSIGYVVLPFGLIGDIPIAAPKYSFDDVNNGSCPTLTCKDMCPKRCFPY
jgi:spore coat protein A, manganese oxidase